MPVALARRPLVLCRRALGRHLVWFDWLLVALDQSFPATGYASAGPDFAVSTDFDFNSVKRSERWTVQYIARLSIECAFVARTLQTLMSSIEVNRTGKMCTLLSKSVITTIERPHQNRGVFLGSITKVK